MHRTDCISVIYTACLSPLPPLNSHTESRITLHNWLSMWVLFTHLSICHAELEHWHNTKSLCSSPSCLYIFGSQGEQQEFAGRPVVRTLCYHSDGPGSISGWGTKIPQVMQHSQEKKKREELAIYWWALCLMQVLVRTLIWYRLYNNSFSYFNTPLWVQFVIIISTGWNTANISV